MIMDEVTYNEIKMRLTVDPMRLTEELMELPQLQQSASEGAAEAQRLRDNAKDMVEVCKADAAAALRQLQLAKPPSEARVASELLLNPEVTNAMAVLRDCEYDLALWKSVADGMRTKSSSIRTIADLIQAGYTTPNAVYSDRRKQINQRRQALKEA